MKEESDILGLCMVFEFLLCCFVGPFLVFLTIVGPSKLYKSVNSLASKKTLHSTVLRSPNNGQGDNFFDQLSPELYMKGFLSHRTSNVMISVDFSGSFEGW